MIKKITAQNTIYLNISDGGTSTPNLYLRSLAAKLHFWKKLCDIEDFEPNLIPSWSLPILRLIKAYKFSKPSFVMISGDNDIKLLKNAFKRNGYNFLVLYS